MFKQLPADEADLVAIFFDGQALQVPKGISVAAAVLTRDPGHTRTTPVSGSKRLPFCMMGVCYDCLMVIDGQANRRACATYVEEGMRIETRQGVGPALESGSHE